MAQKSDDAKGELGTKIVSICGRGWSDKGQSEVRPSGVCAGGTLAGMPIPTTRCCISWRDISGSMRGWKLARDSSREESLNAAKTRSGRDTIGSDLEEQKK